MSACDTSVPKVTCARSVARFTVASCTPGTLRSARSTRPTQLAQVMPPMPRSTDESTGEVVAVSVMASKLKPHIM